MGGGPLATNNSLIVAAFHNALRAQGLVVVLIILLALVLWRPVAEVARRRLGVRPELTTFPPEPAGRRFLRISFGSLWVLDGILQMQQSMVLGLPSDVAQPAAVGSPPWVHHLVNAGLSVWTRHPIA